MAGERASFISPRDGELVVGATHVRFQVPAGDPPLERIDVYVEGILVGSALPPEWSFEWQAPGGLVDVPIIAGLYAAGEMVERLEIRTSEAPVFENPRARLSLGPLGEQVGLRAPPSSSRARRG